MKKNIEYEYILIKIFTPIMLAFEFFYHLFINKRTSKKSQEKEEILREYMFLFKMYLSEDWDKENFNPFLQEKIYSLQSFIYPISDLGKSSFLYSMNTKLEDIKHNETTNYLVCSTESLKDIFKEDFEIIKNLTVLQAILLVAKFKRYHPSMNISGEEYYKKILH